jgi:hypothetical protein
MIAQLLAGPGWEFRYVESAGRRPLAWTETAAAISRADIVYLIGGQIERWSRPDWLVRLVRRPIVMHWVGSDVTYALNAAGAGRASPQLIARPLHWTEVNWTAAELEPLNIRAQVVPLTSARVYALETPLPEPLTVLAYLPTTRPEFYGRSSVYRLATALPDLRFLVVGGKHQDERAPANVEFLGWVDDMREVYARCSVLLRLPEHDGLSFMVLEALAACRYVVWNYPLDGVTFVHSDSDAQAALELLRARQLAGQLPLNDAGRRSVLERYAPEHVRDEILSRLEQVLTTSGG